MLNMIGVVVSRDEPSLDGIYVVRRLPRCCSSNSAYVEKLEDKVHAGGAARIFRQTPTRLSRQSRTVRLCLLPGAKRELRCREIARYLTGCGLAYNCQACEPLSHLITSIWRTAALHTMTALLPMPIPDESRPSPTDPDLHLPRTRRHQAGQGARAGTRALVFEPAPRGRRRRRRSRSIPSRTSGSTTAWREAATSSTSSSRCAASR